MSRSLRLALTTIIGLAFVFLIVAAVHASPAAKRECQNVSKCREAITWNHSVIVTLNARLAIADGDAPGGRAAPVCHTTESCRLDLRRQQHARIWAEGAWQRLMSDDSVTGFQRIIRYRFHPCGAVAVDHALATADGENDFVVNDTPSPTGDWGGWQINYVAHHADWPSDAAFFHDVESGWIATGIAVRWSSCGTNFSPTWVAATKLGIA